MLTESQKNMMILFMTVCGVIAVFGFFGLLFCFVRSAPWGLYLLSIVTMAVSLAAVIYFVRELQFSSRPTEIKVDPNKAVLTVHGTVEFERSGDADMHTEVMTILGKTAGLQLCDIHDKKIILPYQKINSVRWSKNVITLIAEPLSDPEKASHVYVLRCESLLKQKALLQLLRRKALNSEFAEEEVNDEEVETTGHGDLDSLDSEDA